MNGIHEVGGSIPPGSTIFINGLAYIGRRPEIGLPYFWPGQRAGRLEQDKRASLSDPERHGLVCF